MTTVESTNANSLQKVLESSENAKENIIIPEKLNKNKKGAPCSIFSLASIDLNEEIVDDPKLRYVDPSPEDFDLMVIETKDLLKKGQNECLFRVGAGENGAPSGISEEEMDKSVENIERLAQTCNAALTLLRKKKVKGGVASLYLLRIKQPPEEFMEVRIATVGNVDAGKSTLLGVLTYGILDDGRGLSRQKLLRFEHELGSGRTSSVGQAIMGFDENGEVSNLSSGKNDWASICAKSCKVLSFLDLAGHEKYLKTTIFGLTSHMPDYTMLMVGANAGVIGMTKEHLSLVLMLNIPLFIVITKIDMCPPNILKSTLKTLTKLLKSATVRKTPVLVNSMSDALTCALNMSSSKLCPVFQVSNVTGLNLDLLKTFINLLKNTDNGEKEKDKTEFHISEVYCVDGVGTVVFGTMVSGMVQANDYLYLGPSNTGSYEKVSVRSIHRRRMPVDYTASGQSACLALRKIKRKSIRKGMVLIDTKSYLTATIKFDCSITVLHHPTTMHIGYQALIHCNSIRQTATIVDMEKDHLRTGDTALITLKFLRMPEHLLEGAKVVLRDGRTKAIGIVTKVYQYDVIH